MRSAWVAKITTGFTAWPRLRHHGRRARREARPRHVTRRQREEDNEERLSHGVAEARHHGDAWHHHHHGTAPRNNTSFRPVPANHRRTPSMQGITTSGTWHNRPAGRQAIATQHHQLQLHEEFLPLRQGPGKPDHQRKVGRGQKFPLSPKAKSVLVKSSFQLAKVYTQISLHCDRQSPSTRMGEKKRKREERERKGAYIDLARWPERLVTGSPR